VKFNKFNDELSERSSTVSLKGKDLLNLSDLNLKAANENLENVMVSIQNLK
jgi:hypothetical protein